jgi:hypothetical protein
MLPAMYVQASRRRNLTGSLIVRYLYYFDTTVGRFHIVQSADKRFHPVYKSFSLGSFQSPEQALWHLIRGDTLSIPQKIDFTTLGFPTSLEDWRRVLPKHQTSLKTAA